MPEPIVVFDVGAVLLDWDPRHAIVSGAERLLKPQPEIYETLLDRYGLEAADCLFIDDSEKNVRGAEAVGMQALHFTPNIDLAAELRARGVKF